MKKLDAMVLASATIATNLLVAAPAVAADGQTLPAPEMQGYVSYVSGGIGEDEAAAMKRAAAGFPLELQFVQKARPRDEFLAEVKVRIRDGSKNVLLDAVSNGPFVLARLPAGKYQVEAAYNGVTKRQTVDIRASKHERAVFVWAAADELKHSLLENALDGSSYQYR
jgi:hypothetical protein